jgi:hypothetical protein
MSTHIQEKIILRADKWVNNGFCLGYLDGDTYFISGAIPNELVECIPVSLTKKFYPFSSKHLVMRETQSVFTLSF